MCFGVADLINKLDSLVDDLTIGGSLLSLSKNNNYPNCWGMIMKAQKWILSSCALAVALALPSVAVAAEDGAKVERLEVTGSRIKRTDIEGPSPIQSIGKDDIANMGFDNLQQLLEKMPANGAGAFSTRGNSQDSTANGSASISLRGLGPDATLVLTVAA